VRGGDLKFQDLRFQRGARQAVTGERGRRSRCVDRVIGGAGVLLLALDVALLRNWQVYLSFLLLCRVIFGYNPCVHVLHSACGRFRV
jgi:hypothetical protein